MTIVVLNNHDSFVYNLVAYLRELHADVIVKDSSELDLTSLSSIKPSGIVLSPGPGKPSDATLCIEIVKFYSNRIPILGVCLGHQIIAHCFNMEVGKLPFPVHGKEATICHSQQGLFKAIPQNFSAVRYHSLAITSSTLSSQFQIDAWSQDGCIMAISHLSAPLYGVQFHPEAVLSQYGYDLLQNFLTICENWEEN